MGKSFLDNPASQYFSTEKEKKQTEENKTVKQEAKPEDKQKREKKPAGVEVNKIKILPAEEPERKSKQAHFLLKPSNLEKLQKLAKASGRSCNDFLNYLIEQL